MKFILDFLAVTFAGHSRSLCFKTIQKRNLTKIFLQLLSLDILLNSLVLTNFSRRSMEEISLSAAYQKRTSTSFNHTIDNSGLKSFKATIFASFVLIVPPHCTERRAIRILNWAQSQSDQIFILNCICCADTDTLVVEKIHDVATYLVFYLPVRSMSAIIDLARCDLTLPFSLGTVSVSIVLESKSLPSKFCFPRAYAVTILRMFCPD